MSLPPPPTGPVVVPAKSPRRKFRDIGLLVALSAPVSGLLLWITVAIIIGEDRLEGENGQTALGLSMFAIPVVIGVAIAAWSRFARSDPQLLKPGTTAKAMIAVGCLGVAGGIASVAAASNASDASIGGGILTMVGILLCGAGVALYTSIRRN